MAQTFGGVAPFRFVGMALLLGLGLGACSPFPNLVRERYELERACSQDRTTVAQRSDLKPMCAQAAAGTPERAECDRWSVWEATGCGQSLVYDCRETSGRNWCTTQRPRETAR